MDCKHEKVWTIAFRSILEHKRTYNPEEINGVLQLGYQKN